MQPLFETMWNFNECSARFFYYLSPLGCFCGEVNNQPYATPEKQSQKSYVNNKEKMNMKTLAAKLWSVIFYILIDLNHFDRFQRTLKN